MSMNLNDVDDFEEDLVPDQQEPVQNESEPDDNILDDEPSDNSDDEDILTTLLKSKGVDPSSVKFQNDDGTVESKPFDKLSKEEQLQILGFDDSEDNYGLDDEEVNLINHLRSNHLTVKDYTDFIARQAVQQYVDSQQGESYSVDTISDDELYLMDLSTRLNLTEEEAVAELESAKSNPSLYQKKVQGIREEYKQREDALLKQKEQEQEAAFSKQAHEFEQTIINAIQANGDIDLGDSKLSLSNEDKDDIASFILDTDSTGVRYIARALNDPKTLVKMVWYALKGEEAFSEINNYYRKQISEVAKNNYNKGYGDGKSGKAANSAKSIVRKPAATKGNKPLTINDID